MNKLFIVFLFITFNCYSSVMAPCNCKLLLLLALISVQEPAAHAQLWDSLIAVPSAIYNGAVHVSSSSVFPASKSFYQSFALALNKVYGSTSSNISIGELSVHGYEATTCPSSYPVIPQQDGTDFCASCPQGTMLSDGQDNQCQSSWEYVANSTNNAIHSAASAESSFFQSFALAFGKTSGSSNISIGEIKIWGYEVSEGVDGCPQGSIAFGGSSVHCIQCPPGTYADADTQNSCEGAWVPLIASSGAVTYTAQTNVHTSTGVSADSLGQFFFQSFALAFGKTSGSSNISVGEIKIWGYDVVAQCPPGSFPMENNSDFCMQCPMGTFSSSDSCTACPAGTYANSYGSTACTQCAAGTYSSATGATSSATCTACSSGLSTATSAATSSQMCTKVCGTGQYILNGTSCQNCSAGFFAASGTSSSCTACAPGSFSSSSSSSACTLCAAGTFSSTSNSTTCQSCSSGLYSATNGSSACSQCSPGTYSSGSFLTSCESCPPGSYSSSSAAQGCTQCSAGQFSNQWGSTTCSSCPLGTFANRTGQSMCTNCSQCAGTSFPIQLQACNATQNTVCVNTACRAGMYANASTSYLCANCSVGSFTNSTGSTICTFCSAGTYAAAAGSSVCAMCPAGSFSAFSGGSTCFPCAAGRFSSVQGSTGCVACAPGTYSNFSSL